MPDSAWIETVKPLLGTHYELDRLWKEHLDFEAKLADLDQAKWLTSEQEQERRVLQRQKLHGKDKMMAIARDMLPQ